jgi:hypothetical protein
MFGLLLGTNLAQLIGGDGFATAAAGDFTDLGALVKEHACRLDCTRQRAAAR